MQPKLVTILSWSQENVAKEGADPEMKYVLNFNEIEKPMVLNTTNGQSIEDITGSDDLDDWAGKQIVLFNDPTIFFGGQRTGGIRVRAPRLSPQQQLDRAKNVPVPQPVEEKDDLPF
jgi:hypothetical protein